MITISTTSLLIGILALLPGIIILLAVRRFWVTSRAKTVPEVLARCLLCLGCMGKALDRAIVTYRDEHEGLRPQGEAHRVETEEAQRMREKLMVDNPIKKPKSQVLSLLGGDR